MMKSICFVIIALIFLAGGNRKRDYTPAIDFEGVAFIKVIVEDDLDSVRLDITYSNYIPIQSCLVKRFTISEKKDYITSYSITKPELVWFEIKDSTYVTYMLPGDTLIARIGADKTNNDSTSIFFKVDDPIFDFMQNEKKEFGSFLFESPLAIAAYNTQPKTETELEGAIRKIDQSQQARLEFLENNKQNLSKWFVDLYKHNIIYLSANMKFYQYFYLNNRNLNGILVPIDVEIYNPQAIFSSFYWQFIYDYFLLSDTVDNRLFGPPRAIAYYNKAIHRINSNLKDEILEYFNSYYLYTLYWGCDSRNEFQMVDSFRVAANFSLNASEDAYIEEIRTKSLEKIKKLENAKRLKPGSKAPNFYLKDTSGVFHTLSDYKGKLIYLHFWATWCGPCLEEIPSLNKLAKSLADKPVVIINICLDSEYDKWKRIIINEKLEGINLICAGSWERELQESYSFSGIPHYAIVDENGIIVSENCERPDKVYDRLLNLIEK